jgi:hypothetical protein
MEIRVHIERSDESQSLVDTGEVGRGPKIDLTKSNIVEALEAGLVLVQPNFATSDEISWVDELIKGGVASGCWTFEDAESTRMVRLVRGVGSRRNRSSAKELLSTFRGRWYLEASSEPLNILSIVWKEGLRTGYAAFALRQQASKLNAYPTPLSPEFLHDLATNLGRWGKTWSYKKANFDSSAQQSVQRALFRISNPDTPVDRFNHIVDSLLAWYGLAPLPSVVGEEHWSAYLRR